MIYSIKLLFLKYINAPTADLFLSITYVIASVNSNKASEIDLFKKILTVVKHFIIFNEFVESDIIMFSRIFEVGENVFISRIK